MVNDTHDERVRRMHLSLDGLSVGDAFGQRFFSPNEFVTEERIRRNEAPAGRWNYTDDTEMALAIVEVLQTHGRIDQDVLATTFARRYVNEPLRGYGPMARRILETIAVGHPWREVSTAVFGGQGSHGNGGAMRAPPLGAFFADDLALAATEAALSAEVTHAHPDGQAGAIAAAVAAGFAWQHRGEKGAEVTTRFFDVVLEHTPASDTRDGIATAASLPLSEDVETAVSGLGNGSRVISADTVPFSLWCAARHWGDYTGGLWAAVSAGGDRDTTSAIIGGILALSAGDGAIPDRWLRAREALHRASRHETHRE